MKNENNITIAIFNHIINWQRASCQRGCLNLLKFITLEDMHEIVDALTTTLEAKSAYTCGHSGRVAELSLALAKEMDLSLADQDMIHIGGHLHDIGKIGIPDLILNKPGKLTEDEFTIIRQHPEIGSKIVCKVKALRSIDSIVRHHHERFDGTGYPDQLCGREISLAARIVAVADAFDAMNNIRTYRSALGLNQVLDEIWRCRGSQFDPDIVDVLMVHVSKI